MSARLGRFWLSSGVAAIVLGMGALGAFVLLPRVARSYAVAEAGRRGVRLTAEKVRVGWLAVSLEGVDLALQGVDGLEVRFPTVRVELDVRLRPSRVVGRGESERH